MNMSICSTSFAASPNMARGSASKAASKAAPNMARRSVSKAAIKPALAMALVVALAAAIALSAAPVRAFAANPVFADVPESAWYHNDVYAAVKKGLVNGKTDTSFAPNDNLTKAEAVTLASRYHQLELSGKVTIEVGNPWYVNYLEYAERHFLGGWNVAVWGEKIANEPIQRSEFVEIFFQVLPESEYGEINYVADGAIPDVPLSKPYAHAVYMFYRAGILGGSGNDRSFLPDSRITRAEVAAILARMTYASPRVEFSLGKGGEDRDPDHVLPSNFNDPTPFVEYLMEMLPSARNSIIRGMSVLVEDYLLEIGGETCIAITLCTSHADNIVREMEYAVNTLGEIYMYNALDDFWYSMGNEMYMPRENILAHVTLAEVHDSGTWVTLLVDEVVWVGWDDTDLQLKYGINRDDIDNDYVTVNEDEEEVPYSGFKDTLYIVQYSRGMNELTPNRLIDLGEFIEYMGNFKGRHMLAELETIGEVVTVLKEIYTP